MVVVEGVARKLYPETNIWEVSKPVLENWLKNVKSPKSTIDTAINRLELGEIRRTRLSQVAAAIWLTEENRATIICFRSVEKYLRDLLLISCKKGSEVGVW